LSHTNDTNIPTTTGQCASLACLLEVHAPKPGNVHRGADFDDLKLADFLVAATAIAPAMDAAVSSGVGKTVLSAVSATRRLVPTNANLGIILLLAPLAAVPRDVSLQMGVSDVLRQLSPDDAKLVYQAIQVAQPGGMGQVENHDVAGPPPESLLAAMQLAAEKDTVAKQYVTDFAFVFDFVCPTLLEYREQTSTLASAIVATAVKVIAEVGDSLIARKGGKELSEQAAQYAGQVLKAGPPSEPVFWDAVADLDFWLRSTPKRNPGTTADLLTAGLFALLRDDRLEPPYR
jgi:triphosphoribosyl-dephospho-CoA synthase